MNTFHLSGYPRIGAKRELKFAVEAFWKGAKSEAELQQVAADIRRANWATQKAAGADLLPVGDFSICSAPWAAFPPVSASTQPS